jgi:hypothetical protein
MNDDRGLSSPRRHQLSRRSEVTTGAGRLTPLQDWLITAYLMLEDAHDELTAEQWRALIWILCDRIGDEAAQLMVGEALEAIEEAA